MRDNLLIKKSLQTTILTDGVRKHRQTAEQYIQANERRCPTLLIYKAFSLNLMAMVRDYAEPGIYREIRNIAVFFEE